MKKFFPFHASKHATAARPLVTIFTMLVVLALVAMLMLVIQGYRFNSFDGKIEQGGLLQYDSRPNGADVYIDSAHLGNKTANKITVSSGDHTVRMVKDGYNEWSKDVTIEPGAVLWLNYTRLIPTEKQIDTITTVPTVTSAVPSENQKYIAFKDDPTTPSISVATIDSDTPKIDSYALTEGSYTTPTDAANQSYTIESWDSDSRYVLVRHAYDTDKNEWLVVDTRGTQATVNVTTSMGVTIDRVEFSLGDDQVLYVQTPAGDIRRVDLGAKTISAPIVSNVDEFAQYDRSTITYVTKIDDTTKTRTVGYMTNGASKPRTLKTYADLGETPLHLRIGRYFNQTYVAVAYGETLDITTGDLPSSDSSSASALTQVGSLTIPGGVTSLAFSPDTERFVYARTADAVFVYDLELKTLSTTKVDSTDQYAVRWVDREHFVTTTGTLAMYDFDGTNRQELLSSSAGLPAVISPNNKYIFAFTKDANGAHLQRLKLLID